MNVDCNANDLISRGERLRQIRQTELDDYRSAMLISDAKKMIRTFIEEAPAVDAVSRSVLEQIKWERDCAMQQLKDHGIPFGGIAPAVDAVVLPVKPGSVVWILNHRFEAEVEEICIREDGVFAVWVEYYRGPELTEVWDDGEFDIKEVGKTVFLTVEELEKAETEG